MKFNSNFNDVSENYLFAEVAKRAAEYSKNNPDKKVLKLGIGDVTLPLAREVINALHGGVEDMARAETFKGYGPYEGYGFLRESIQSYYKSYGVDLALDEIFVSDGAKSDLGNILDIFSKENCVLVPDPVYPVYVDTNLMAGRKVIFADANAANGFLPMPDYGVNADIIYLCSPNNPTGAAYSKAQLKEWVDYANRKRAVILYDAAYECFIEDENLARSIFQIEGAKTCAIEFCSFSKTAGFTGTRCGYTVVPKSLEKDGFSANKMWYRRQATKFNGVPYIVQKGAGAVFTEQGRKEINENIAYYKNNAKIIAECLDGLGIWYTGGKNSPYIWLKCPEDLGSWEFFDYLLQNAQVVGTPGAGFGKNGEGYFRLTAFGSEEVTREAVGRIESVLKNNPPKKTQAEPIKQCQTAQIQPQIQQKTAVKAAKSRIFARGNGRSAGVLCHISSLWGKYGIGSLGKEAYQFADFLKSAHVKYWQILPLVQTGYGNSPYSSVCCSSGNPYFIDLDTLAEQGLLDREELESCETVGGDVDYDNLFSTRYDVLKLAFARFDKKDEEFINFVNGGEYDAYATFMALCARYGGSMEGFPAEYRDYNTQAVKNFKEEVYKTDYLFWQFVQFQFSKQWKRLKNYVNSLGIKIIGDIPLYVAYDSSDVWEHPELFRLDEDMNPVAVAGVPPDYFCKTGQLWGNPLYDWEKMEEDGYDWWVNRIRKAAELYDVIRIDHFRGLDRYYAVPADAETAETGEWVDGPKEKLFEAVRERLGEVPMIAEDLGFMDDGVIKLRLATGFPGMKIALFAFDGDPDNEYLPHNMPENSVAYTGTHDNATTLGLLEKMTEAQFEVFKKRLRAEMQEIGLVLPFVTREEAARALIALTLASPAKLAIIPVQDMLGLNDEARMNIPSTVEGNWQFRLFEEPSRYDAAVMRKMVREFNR